MTIRGFENIEPVMFDAACAVLGLQPPYKLGKALVAGDGTGYLANKGAYRQFCDKLESEFRRRTALADGVKNKFALQDVWRDSHVDASLGSFISAASLEAASQQP